MFLIKKGKDSSLWLPYFIQWTAFTVSGWLSKLLAAVLNCVGARRALRDRTVCHFRGSVLFSESHMSDTWVQPASNPKPSAVQSNYQVSAAVRVGGWLPSCVKKCTGTLLHPLLQSPACRTLCSKWIKYQPPPVMRSRNKAGDRRYICNALGLCWSQ